MNELAQYFQELRDARGLSRARLAGLVGTTEQSIWRIETKGQQPEPELLARIVDTLGATWEDVEALLLRGGDAAALARARTKIAQEPEDVRAAREKLLSLPPDAVRALAPLAERLLKEAQ